MTTCWTELSSWIMPPMTGYGPSPGVLRALARGSWCLEFLHTGSSMPRSAIPRRMELDSVLPIVGRGMGVLSWGLRRRKRGTIGGFGSRKRIGRKRKYPTTLIFLPISGLSFMILGESEALGTVCLLTVTLHPKGLRRNCCGWDRRGSFIPVFVIVEGRALRAFGRCW